MARILICEPDPDVRSLVAFVVRRIGHEPIMSDGTRDQALAVDAIVLEPGDADALELGHGIRLTSPAIPIVCVSIFQQPVYAFQPDAYLVKPFSLDELGWALATALGEPLPVSTETPRDPRSPAGGADTSCRPRARRLGAVPAEPARRRVDTVASISKDVIHTTNTRVNDKERTEPVPASPTTRVRPSPRYAPSAVAELIEQITIDQFDPLELACGEEMIPADWEIRLAAIKRRRKFVVICGGKS
jgi:hypothetical protein